MARKWQAIVLHHTATGPHETVDSIRAMHLKRRFADIGYHYILARGADGRGYLKAGRPDSKDGAHCPGMNSKALGFSVVGYFHPGSQYTERLKEPLLGDVIGAVAHLCKKYNIPVENITYHRDHKATACPGNNFIPRDMLRELVKQRLEG